MKLLSIAFLSALCVSTCLAQSKADTTKATEIIGKSVDAYAHLKTYADSGKVIKTIINNGRTTKTALIFKTDYTNTGGLNFECYKVGQSNSLYVINRSDDKINVWWGITNQETNPPNLSDAFAGASGGLGSSMMVPQLLLTKDFKGRNYYKSLKAYTLTAVEKVNGQECYKIKGDGSLGNTAIWVSKKDFLIRKVETEKVVDPEKVQATLHKIAEEMKKKDSVKYKGTIDADKSLAEANKRIGHPNGPFTVKDSYTFVPVINHKIDPEQLKYRPNREVAL